MTNPDTHQGSVRHKSPWPKSPSAPPATEHPPKPGRGWALCIQSAMQATCHHLLRYLQLCSGVGEGSGFEHFNRVGKSSACRNYTLLGPRVPQNVWDQKAPLEAAFMWLVLLKSAEKKKKQNNNVHEEKSANFWAGWVQGAALKTWGHRYVGIIRPLVIECTEIHQSARASRQEVPYSVIILIIIFIIDWLIMIPALESLLLYKRIHPVWTWLHLTRDDSTVLLELYFKL